jgi:hypothetical protein
LRRIAVQRAQRLEAVIHKLVQIDRELTPNALNRRHVAGEVPGPPRVVGEGPHRRLPVSHLAARIGIEVGCHSSSKWADQDRSGTGPPRRIGVLGRRATAAGVNLGAGRRRAPLWLLPPASSHASAAT